MKKTSYGKYRRKFHDGSSRHELPRTADDIDLDRLVWDPVYRRAVRGLIAAEEDDDDDDDAAPDNV